MTIKDPTCGKKIQKANYLIKLPWSIFNVYNHPNYLSKLVSRHGCEWKINYASTVFFEEHQRKIVLWFSKVQVTRGVTRDNHLIPLGLFPHLWKHRQQPYLSVLVKISKTVGAKGRSLVLGTKQGLNKWLLQTWYEKLVGSLSNQNTHYTTCLLSTTATFPKKVV